jgi:hypothetical protein
MEGKCEELHLMRAYGRAFLYWKAVLRTAHVQQDNASKVTIILLYVPFLI